MTTVDPCPPQDSLLAVARLAVHFPTYQGLVRALDAVELSVGEGAIVGLIGETGCGKTVTAYSILRLIRSPGRIVEGEVIFEGKDLLRISEGKMRSIRGKRISMIFQRPVSSLNPVFPVGKQLRDVIRLHTKAGKKEADSLAIRSLERVVLPEPASVMRKFPHELSGGMQQRVMIAMALSCGASLMIADEPTTALDVSIQLQILKLIRGIVDAGQMAVLLISHDMAVIGIMCDQINVMYAGRIVETGMKDAVIDHPAHPYTEALLQAIPGAVHGRDQRLQVISGTIPSLINPPDGCRFAPRCPRASENCIRIYPPRILLERDHYVNCHLYQEEVETGAFAQSSESPGARYLPGKGLLTLTTKKRRGTDAK